MTVLKGPRCRKTVLIVVALALFLFSIVSTAERVWRLRLGCLRSGVLRVEGGSHLEQPPGVVPVGVPLGAGAVETAADGHLKNWTVPKGLHSYTVYTSVLDDAGMT